MIKNIIFAAAGVLLISGFVVSGSSLKAIQGIFSVDAQYILNDFAKFESRRLK